MSYAKVYIYFVFTTKNRIPFLDSLRMRRKVWLHIKENAEEKGLCLEIVNGYTDHCHCLVSMDRDWTIAEVMHLIKGESAFWINKHKLCKERFSWQDQYFAISVSESIVQRVRNYILNQENHHKKKDFQSEYDVIVKEHAFSIKKFS
jgi:putative transposase